MLLHKNIFELLQLSAGGEIDNFLSVPKRQVT
jgi:hypothetical protein